MRRSPIVKQPLSLPRFSLATLILVFLLSVVAISHFASSLRHFNYRKTTEAELDRLRKELGYLVIDNPDDLHVVNVVAVEPILRWRVQVPEEKNYELVVVIDGKPIAGVPQIMLPSGKSTFSISLTHSRDRWYVNSSVTGEDQTRQNQNLCVLQWLDVRGESAIYTSKVACSHQDSGVQITESFDKHVHLCRWFKNESDRNEISRTIDVFLEPR